MAPPAPELFDAAFLQRLELLRVVARRTLEGASAGSRPGRGAGPGLEFAEHRPYLPGDDFRHVDWAAYARLERLLLRLAQQEEDLAVTFLLDASASMATGRPPKFDHARRLVAALAYVALAGLERVRLVAVADRLRAHLEAGRGKHHALRVLEFLAAVAPEGTTDLAAAVRDFLPHAPRAGLAVLVSDLMDPDGYRRALLALQERRFDLWCLHVTDPLDVAPPGDGDVTLVDAETGHEAPLHLSPDVRRRLSRQARDFADHAAAWCREHAIGYAEAPTRVPVDDLVLDVLRRGGLLR